MRAHEFITEAKTVDFQGLTLKTSENNHELMIDALDDWGNKVLGHVTFYKGDDRELDPQDLWVNEKYQGQGIARVMYDYVKKLGYTIVRSWDQTPAGAGFWNKHRGEDVRVWESPTQSVAERKKSRRKKSSRYGGYFFPGYAYYSSGDSGEGGGDGGGGESRSSMAGGNAKKQAVRRIQKMLNDRFDANLDIDGVMGPLTQKSINWFMPGARPGAADDPDRTTAVQGRQQKNSSQAEDQLDELSFLGSECTKDCSGHRAGYDWSKRQGLRQANSWSPSFNKGAGLAAAGK
jgi:hypothetical protein